MPNLIQHNMTYLCSAILFKNKQSFVALWCHNTEGKRRVETNLDLFILIEFSLLNKFYTNLKLCLQPLRSLVQISARDFMLETW